MYSVQKRADDPDQHNTKLIYYLIIRFIFRFKYNFINETFKNFSLISTGLY